MNIRDIFITLRYKISYGSTVEWYNFWYIVLRKKRKIIPQVASIDETIRKIIDDRCSVSRFGDGEVLLTSPEKEIRFQKGDPLLAKRLTEVLQSHEEKDILSASPTHSAICIATIAKVAGSGELIFICTVRGGTVCW